jgi:hypothetical protein
MYPNLTLEAFQEQIASLIAEKDYALEQVRVRYEKIRKAIEKDFCAKNDISEEAFDSLHSTLYKASVGFYEDQYIIRQRFLNDLTNLRNQILHHRANIA